MDAYEATKAVFSRIQSLDKENASKIMGLLLIQDHGEKEMIRLAFGPENLLHSLVVKARLDLGISTQNSIIACSSRFLPNTTTVNIPTSITIPTLLTPSSPSWEPSFFDDGVNNLVSKSTLNPSSPPFYGGGSSLGGNDTCPTIKPKSSDVFYSNRSQLLGNSGVGDSMLKHGVSNDEDWGEGSGLPHRRSCSVSDINLGSYSRGFYKRGSEVSKLEMMEKCHELLRSKSMQHQKFMAYSMNKGLSLFGKNQRNVSPRYDNYLLIAYYSAC